jgi:hypothetical protein
MEALDHLLRSVMNQALIDDLVALRGLFPPETLAQALAGEFSGPAWSYWHAVFGVAPDGIGARPRAAI